MVLYTKFYVFSRRDRSAEDGRRRAATAPISPAHTLVTADHRPAGEDEKKREREEKRARKKTASSSLTLGSIQVTTKVVV